MSHSPCPTMQPAFSAPRIRRGFAFAPTSADVVAHAYALGRRVLRALGLLPSDTAEMFLGLADDLFGAWPRGGDEGAEATSLAARRARAGLSLVA